MRDILTLSISHQVAHFFEDPDGRIELPHALKVDFWKRPQDFIVDAVTKLLFILQCLCQRLVQVLVSESEAEMYFFFDSSN